MKAEVTERSSTQSTAGSSTAETGSSTQRRSHSPSFTKVFDGRKNPIRGLWVRNGRYYAQLKVENQITGVIKTKRVPLVDGETNAVETVAQAVAQMARLRTQRADNALPVLARQPKFADYAKIYLETISSGAKKKGTVEKEKAILGRWADFLGQLRLDQIKRVHVNRFIESRHREKDKDGNP